MFQVPPVTEPIVMFIQLPGLAPVNSTLAASAYVTDLESAGSMNRPSIEVSTIKNPVDGVEKSACTSSTVVFPNL